MGFVEKRGKNSWRICTQVKVGGEWQWVRPTIHMDPDLPEDTQRREATRELLKLETRLAGELPEVPTLRAWSETWLEKHLDDDASPVTVANYRYLLGSRILPILGDKPITDLTPALLTDWLHQVRHSPRKSTRLPEDQLSRPRRQGEKLISASKAAKPLSVKTTLLYYGCMKTMLAAAVRIGLLEYNPMDRVKRPKQRKRKPTTLPERDVVALLSLIIDEAPQSLRLAVLLAMLCGLRLGEVGALRYMDVDWDAGTINISQALKYAPGTGSFLEVPKTDAGERVITLPPTMLRILRDAMYLDLIDEQDSDGKWKSGRWIVHSRYGARVNKDTPSKWFRAFADANGYEGITFHDLRHIHASILLAKHVDLASVSARMGHSDPEVTLRVYADALPPNDQAAATTMDALLTTAVPNFVPLTDPTAAPADPVPADPADDSGPHGSGSA